MKRKRIDPETLARWAEERREYREMAERRLLRLAEGEARQAAYRARLRRLTFGLLGREPAPDTEPAK